MALHFLREAFESRVAAVRRATARPASRPAAIPRGATVQPTWIDVPPMLYAGNPLPAAPGMVLFLHAILADADAGLAMSAGHTLIITDEGAEMLSRLPLEHVVCG